MKRLFYLWLRWRGYKINEIIHVQHVDDLFSNPPRVYRRSSELVMRRGLSVHTLRFRHLDAEQLEAALIEEGV
jgi:hypothetical protein